MKISNLVEQIFAQAVALDQSGGLKNTIYAIHNEIFILNHDHSVLLRFVLRKNEASFDAPISFKANDYDSNVFEQVDGRIIFHSIQGAYERKKICGLTDITPSEVQALYVKYTSGTAPRQAVILTQDVLSLLDDSLSHVEFRGLAGQSIQLLQRNIYSGGIIEIKKTAKGFFTETLKADFGPIALKTDDFKAMFTFQSALTFEFPTLGDDNFVIIKSTDKNVRDMTAVIACCLYDEIIELREAQVNKQPAKPKMTRTV
jgi:hypothetical protein